MQNNTVLEITNEHILELMKILNRVPNDSLIPPTGIFWTAYDALRSGDEEEAYRLLRSAYFDDNGNPIHTQRSRMVCVLSHRLPLTLEGFGLIELLAAAGQTILLGQLHNAGSVRAIHAIHAEVELNERLMPNPELNPEPGEFECLAELYKMEQMILADTFYGPRKTFRWMARRNRRVLKYRNMVEYIQSIMVSH